MPCASALAASGGVVGLAGPRGVTLFHGGAHRRLAAPALAGATAVVPVADTPAGRLWWLVRLPSGWASFGAGPTATSGPHVLRGMPATADPAPPVESAGGVYTLDRRASGQPALWVLDPASGAVGTVSGLARYPAKSRVERASFTGAELLVDGPRVVYNNPGSLLAVVVFTDGSHRPVVVDKASAVDVDASGPVAIARTAARHGHGRGRHGKGRPRAAGPAQPARHGAGPTVDEQLRCADTTQKPYAPVVQPVSASSESALVSWSYVLLDEQDCEPDSWVVRLTALDGSPPPLQPTTVVRGQQQAEIGGLRPSTTYAAVVVAVINHQQTASQPVTFRTTAEGPEAPSSVTTRVEADGSWLVSWAPCQGAACYVPAAQWYVIATACGGSFAGQPPDATVPGGSRSVVVEAPALGLLGTSMSFSVEGISAEGLRGNPTSDHACTQSFRRPDASAISVTGSATPGPGRTVTATIDVSPPAGGSAGALTYGSQSTDFAYDVHPLSGRGPTFTQTTTRTAATFTGLPPGVPYQATVTVTPAGHAGDAVAVTSPPFSSDIPWPALATTPPQVTRGPDFTAGTVAVAFTGLAADTYVANQVALSCDGATQPVGEQVPLQGSRLTVEVDDLVTFGGTNCRLLVGSLTDEGPDSPYGSGRSPTGVSVPFGFPAAPTYQFQAAYGTESCPGGVGPIQLQCPDVSVRAAQGDDPGDQWVVAVQGTGQGLQGRDCTGAVRDQQPTLQDPVVVALPYGCAGPATATVSWHYYGQPQPPVTLTPGGSAPTTTTTSSTTTSSTTTSSTTTSSTTAPSSTSTGSTAAGGAGSATLA
ncbi:MAG TPA: hypothetical protein VKV25_10135, partial [Acidimicrobiales bacterium]|nr:hypothetical protein [Acidimicrobiales bacterium]